MPTFEYRILPFLGDIRSRDQRSAQRVSEQLKATIDANIGDGWEFYRIDQVQILVRPGCLAAIFGARASTMALDQVIFRRDRDGSVRGFTSMPTATARDSGAIATPGGVATTFCSGCGAALSPTTQFCDSCGTAVT